MIRGYEVKKVIVFTLDTLRRDVLGSYGNDNGLTHFFDSIQDKCIRFTKCQAVESCTQASFPGIPNSSYCLDHGKTPRPQLSSKRALISELVKSAGIYAAAFNSNHYLSGHFGWDRGWQQFYDSM